MLPTRGGLRHKYGLKSRESCLPWAQQQVQASHTRFLLKFPLVPLPAVPAGCGFGGCYGSLAAMPIFRMILPQFEGNWAHLGNVSPLPRMFPGILLLPGLFPSSPRARLLTSCPVPALSASPHLSQPGYVGSVTALAEIAAAGSALHGAGWPSCALLPPRRVSSR